MEWKWKIWHTNGSFVFYRATTTASFNSVKLSLSSLQKWILKGERERERNWFAQFLFFFCQFPGKKSHQKEKKTIFYYLIERAREKMMIISIVFNDGGYKIIIIIIIIIFLEISRFRVFIIIQQQQQQLSKWTCTPTLNT